MENSPASHSNSTGRKATTEITTPPTLKVSAPGKGTTEITEITPPPMLQQTIVSVGSPVSLNASVQIPVKLAKNGTNYASWKAAMTNLLYGYGFLGYVDGTTPRPNKSNPGCLFWTRQDRLVLLSIQSTVMGAISPMIDNCTSSQEAWAKLESSYAYKPTTRTLPTSGMEPTMKNKMFLYLSCLVLAIGTCGGPLIMRLYFIHGGKRIWLSSFVQTAGWPITFILLIIAYIRRCCNNQTQTRTRIFLMKPGLFIAATVIGLLTGVDDYLYAYGVSKLPVSTSSLILASKLAFTAGFAFFLVKQKFTHYSVNAIALLTLGAVILGLHASSDRPKGESKKEYFLGFGLTLAGSALYGLILPLLELTYTKAKQAITYTLVLEIQMVMCFFATVFCAIGMLVNHDFQAISKEAKEFQLGEAKYYLVVIFGAISWQGFFIGATGVTFYSSSLMSGIMMTVLLPITEILAVIFYHEKFQVEKGISIFLSVWGFISYFYGEMKNKNIAKQDSTHAERQPTEHSPTPPL